MKLPPDDGINHLTTDTDIYNCLRKAQQTNEYLRAFELKYMDETFTKDANNLEANVIYIVRRGSELMDRGDDCQTFRASIQVVIAIRKYDTVQAQTILKTMYKIILHALVNDPCFDFMSVEEFHFEYSEPGILDRGVITFTAVELEDYCFDVDLEPLKIILNLRTNIEGTNVYTKKLMERDYTPFKPKEVEND